MKVKKKVSGIKEKGAPEEGDETRDEPSDELRDEGARAAPKDGSERSE